MLIFFLFISLVNLAIGYIVAVKFHTTMFPEPTRERELVRTADEVFGVASPFSIDASQMPVISQQPPLAAIPPKKLNPQSPTLATRTTASEPATATEPKLSLADRAESPSRTLPATEDQLPSESPEAFTSVSVADFMRGITDFRAQLTELDQRVQNCAKSPDTRQIEGCVQEFREANSRYLEQTSEVKGQLDRAEPSESEFANNARQVMQVALAKQTEEVRLTEDKLSQLDIEADPQGSCDTLLSASNTLASSTDKLRAELEVTKRNLQAEGESGSEAKDMLVLDELTQIPSRAMFDVELQQQVKQGESYCLAVADIDRCAQLNQGYGEAVTDEVLKVVAKVIAASARGECRAARYGGQQFAVLFPSYQLAEAALAVETIRQSIHLTQFNHDESRLEVSVSIALMMGSANDSLPTLEQRIQEGVAAVKNHSRNHSYQFQSGKAELISPPDLDLTASSYEV